MSQPWKTRLTEEQRTIVEGYNGGPMTIQAIPGSGKTHTACALAAELWQKFPPIGKTPRVRMITFTKKAAGEARERLIKHVGDAAANSVLHFHKNALLIYYFLGDRETFWPKKCTATRFSSSELKQIAKDAIASGHINEKDFFDFWHNLVHESSDFSQFENAYLSSSSIYSIFMEDIIEMYRKQKKIPLDLLSPIATSILKERGKGICEFLIVDEFQDTDAAQFEMAIRMVYPHRNLIVVGDLHQAIYRWRGAKPENITTNFKKRFPEVQERELTVNFRSVPSILESGSKVLPIFYQQSYIHKAYKAPSNGDGVEVFLLTDSFVEAGCIAKWIEEKRNKYGLKYSDFKVVYRYHSIALNIQKKLIECQIPFKVVDKADFFGSAVVRDLFAYMHWALNPKDVSSATRIINKPRRGIGAVKLSKMNLDYTIPGKWPTEPADDLKKLLTKLNSLVEEGKINNSDWLHILTYDTGLYDIYKSEEKCIESLLIMLEWARMSDENKIDQFMFLSDFMISADVEEDTGDEDKVQLMTIHAAKGLESPAVFVASACEDVIPGRSASDVQEECHLAYVAATRAERFLAIGVPFILSRFASERIATEMSRFYAPLLDYNEVKITTLIS